MANLGQFAGNFLTALNQTRMMKQKREEDKKEKDARLKLYEIQLEREKRAQAESEQAIQARDKLFGKLNPVVIDESGAAGATPEGGPYGGVGPTRLPRQPQKPPSLTELLADPENAMLLLRSGMGNLGDITKIQGQSQNQALLQSLMGGAGGGGGGAPSGMELSGLKLDPSGRPMLDFARREIWQEVPSPDGMSMVQIDRQGRELGRRPISPGEQKLSPQRLGEEAVDREFAKEYVAFKASGGFADVEKSLTQLQGAAKALEEGGLTGPIQGRVPDVVRGFINPRSLAVRDTVEEVVQRNLRLVLGPQFTEKEGERLIARAYNEQLDDKENAGRVKRLMKQIKSAAAAKQEAIEYFEANGTLEGFMGKIWTMADFMGEWTPKENGGTTAIDFSELPP